MKHKIVFLAFSYVRGGAALAAQKFAKLASNFGYIKCYCAEPSIVENIAIINPSKVEFGWHFIKRMLSLVALQLMRDGVPGKHSLNLFSSKAADNALRKAAQIDALLHVHWVNNDTLSVKDFARLPCGTIITLHDEWLYCGAEHCYPVSQIGGSFITGYDGSDRRIFGINWNKLVWQRKYEAIKSRDDLIFTVPSSWMFDRAKQSLILSDKDVRILPNPIETEIFQPLATNVRSELRAKLGFNEEDVVISFGAVGGENNILKGGTLLREACMRVFNDFPQNFRARVKVLLFGGGRKGVTSYEGFKAFSAGCVSSAQQMREIYGIADVLVVPSMVESFGQVAAESLSCKTPVVAFRCSGLTDIITDGLSGFLAEPFDPLSLASCLKRSIMLEPEVRALMGSNGRKQIEARFSPKSVAPIYHKTLQDSLMKSKLQQN